MTITVAHFADVHIDESSRWDEQRRLLDWTAADVAARGVRVVTIGGDLFERGSTPSERAVAADWIRALAETAAVVLVKGNHDKPGDLALFARLRTRHPVHVVETYDVVRLHAGTEDVAIGCLAWPELATLLAAAGVPLGHEQANELAAQALKTVLLGLGTRMREAGGRRLLVTHAMVRGAVTSVGQPLFGSEMEIGAEDLVLADAEAILLGHIHKAQEWVIGDVPVIYPGSTRRRDYGELEGKAYTLVHLLDGGQLDWQAVPIPAMPMVRLSGEWRDGAVQLVGEVPPCAGADVRADVTFDSDEREAARRGIAAWREGLLAGGAAVVRVEHVPRAVSKARVPEVARAATVSDQLQAMWTGTNTDPGEERGRRLKAMAERLHAESRSEE